jgi:hypothetical protein
VAVGPVDLIAFFFAGEDIIDDHTDMRGCQGTGTVI